MERRIVRAEISHWSAQSTNPKPDIFIDNFGDVWEPYYGSDATRGTNQIIRNVDIKTGIFENTIRADL